MKSDPFAHLPPEARLYLRPTGWVEGPFVDPQRVVRLAGGTVWFSQVHVVARLGTRRIAQALLSAQDAETRFGESAAWQGLVAPRAPLLLGKTTLPMDRPHVMGIVNVTPDSFSDGRTDLSPQAVLAHAAALATAGAHLLDVGAESTRPGSKPIPLAEEQARLEPILAPACALGTPVSLDTRKAPIMALGLKTGAGMINDISSLKADAKSLETVRDTTAAVVLMHTQGEPGSLIETPHYDDVLLDVYDWLQARLADYVAAGIARTRIVIDPGLGFGKNLRHNLSLMNGLSLFHALGCPLLLGASRKRMVGALSREEPPQERLAGSLALAHMGLQQGVQMLRVHDVAPTVQMLRVWQGVRDEALTPPPWLVEDQIRP